MSPKIVSLPTQRLRLVLWVMALCGGFLTVVDGPKDLSGSDLGQADEKQVLPFELPPGFVAELVAEPPLVEYPMHACFDDRGRLFVADSLGINPKGEQKSTNPTQVIRVLEDTKGDGHFDKSTIFADKLVFPEGVLWFDGSVYTASPPSLWRLETNKATGLSRQRQELVTGFPNTGIADDLHGPTVGPDGRIYWSCGRFAHQIRRPGDKVLWKGRAPLILRCKADGGEVEVISGAQGNPVKVVFTPEGEPLCCGTWAKADNTRTDLIIHSVEGGNYSNLNGDFFSPEFKHTPEILPAIVSFGPASASGVVRYRSGTFGEEYRGNLFSALFNMHKVQRHVLERDGATFRALTEDFIVSKNANFRPADVIEDADGSLLIVNTGTWSACCEAFRAGGQPKVQGSIYRIRRQGASAPTDPRGLQLNWDGLTLSQLIFLMDDPKFAVRDQAVGQLVKHGSGALALVREALRNGASVRARRNALWALTRIGGAEAHTAIRAALTDKSDSVRLTAAYSVGLDRDTAALPRLLELVKSDIPPLRRQAATSLGRIRRPEAVPVLLDALKTGGDRFLEHALTYALIQIADREGTLKGLADPIPQVRYGALIALDQMDGGNLTKEQVTPLLNTDDFELQKTALAVITKRPGWAKEIVSLLGEWLDQKEVPVGRQESLRGVVIALCKDPAIVQLVAQALQKQATAPATRLLLLETIARAPLDRLPDSWVQELGRHLDNQDDRIVRQAVAAVQAGHVAQFDEALARLAKNKNRSTDVRLAALAAAETRLAKLEPELFDFLTANLDEAMAPLTRLSAASCLGNAPLDDRQLETITRFLPPAGALEMPHLAAAFERSKNPDVGHKLIDALARAPVLQSLSPETLTRIVRSYPADVRQAAGPLFKRLEVDVEKQKAKLALLEPVLAGGDAKRGREVFFGKKAACATCHTVRSEGGKIGPDLSKIGAIRSNRDLLVAIVLPSASFARGYEPYVVATKSGKFYPAGILRRETADAIYLTTSDRAELRIARADIDTIVPGRVSIMPEGLDAQITRQELADVIAFLQTLK